MTVKELIDILSGLNSDSQVLVRFIDEECGRILVTFNEGDVEVTDGKVILDISDK